MRPKRYFACPARGRSQTCLRVNVPQLAKHLLDMSEPLPSLPTQAPPTNAEDRKAAAALSSLDAQHQSDEDNEHGSKPSKQALNIDQEALGRAISRLELSSKGKEPKTEGVGKGKAVDGDVEEEAKKKIKIDQGDVLLLVRREADLPLISSLSLERGPLC